MYSDPICSLSRSRGRLDRLSIIGDDFFITTTKVVK